MSWRCTWCGREYETNDPPCDTCGHNTFAHEDDEREPQTVDTGTQYIWICTNCGREHVKNNPPCSRCHNHSFEKREQDYDGLEADLDVPSWFDVAKPYLPVFAIIGLVFALFATGIVSPTVLPGIGSTAPTPPDAPGATDEAAGLDLALTEREIHDRLEAERAASDHPARAYDDGLAAYAAYENARYVLEQSGEDPGDASNPAAFDPDCAGESVAAAPLGDVDGVIDDYDDEAALADDLASALLESPFGDNVRTGFDAEGIDVHVVDGTIYVFYAAC